MRVLLAAVFLTLSLTGSALAAGPCGSADVDVRNAYAKAEDLKDFSERELVIYAMGFVNGLIGSAMANSTRECVDRLYECIAEKTSANLGATLQKYIAAHPEELSAPASIVTFKAIFLPCRSRA